MSETTDKFATPSDCLKVISDLELSLLPRSTDRALINTQFNGGRPFTPEEEKEHQIQVNANFLEGYKIAQNAIMQMNGALLYKERFFNARCRRGKITKRQEWSESFTNNIHKPLKRSHSGKKFNYLMLNRDAALVVHGVGPLWWSDDHSWSPKFVALDDLLIPTDSPLEFSEELGHFAVNSTITPWQLYKTTQKEKSDPGWNKPLAMKVLQALLSSENFTPDYFNSYGAPEKMESLWKQRSTYLNSDAVPKVKLTTFYHQDPYSGGWYRKVLVRENQTITVSALSTDDFLYESSNTFADSIDEILHMQYGDGSVVAPFKYRSVRGLGVLLYSVIELMNRLRNQFTQHVFSNLVPLLRVENPQDQDRPRMLQLQPYAVVDQGVTFVPQNERHQIDPRLVTESMNEFRQLMTESSSSYVQDIDNGTGREQTLGEAQIKLQSANKIVSGMLQGAYIQEAFLYEEIVRRFLSKVSGDPQIEQFQADCRADGIPDELMKPEVWSIEITKAFGAGDQTLAQQEATALMQLAPQLDPTSQRKVRRSYISVMTRNPELANDLVPEEKVSVTSGRKAADSQFGTLMAGGVVGTIEGIEQVDFIAGMLGSMDAVINRIHQTDDVGTPADVRGLNAVATVVEEHIQILSQDPNEKEAVVAAGKALGKMQNDIKAFAQRQEEAAKANQQDPEVMQKLETDKVAAAQAMHITEQKSQQALQQKQATFEQKLNQDQQKFTLQIQQMAADSQTQIQQTQADAQAQAIKTSSEMAAMNAKADAELLAMVRKVEVEIETMQAKATAEIAASKKKAEAAPATPAE